MAGLRKRAVVKEDSPPPEDPPEDPEDAIDQLSVAIKELKQTATKKGLSAKDIQECVGSAAEKNRLRILRKPRKKKRVSVKKSSTSPLRSTLLLCYKLSVVMSLIWITGTLLFNYSDTFSGFILKYSHTSLYSIIRPVRIGISILAPLFSLFGLELVHPQCFLSNPFTSEEQYCPCMRVHQPIDLQITPESPFLPDKALEYPTYQYYIARDALDTSNVTLEAFRDFKRNHPTQRGPKTCLKLTTNTEVGVQKMSELYNPEILEEHMNSKEAWAFTWEECPTEERPQTFCTLLPEPDYLPIEMDMELSEITLFTLSTKWSSVMHHESSFPNSTLVAVAVLIGEVRFTMDQMYEHCMDFCGHTNSQFVLNAGDVLLFDQTHWSYLAATWSKFAITSAMAVYKIDGQPRASNS